MPRIVAIHGIAQQFKGEHTLAAAWLPALRDGLARVGAPGIADRDLAVAFYGDLFRPEGKAVMPAYDAQAVNDEWELELLRQWWEELARIDPAAQPPNMRGKARTPQFVQGARAGKLRCARILAITGVAYGQKA